MTISHSILVEGNSLSFRDGFFGFSTIALLQSEEWGPLLFDTGHHSTRLLLLRALKEHGLTPIDIKSVFLSHLHFDHVNNVELFPNATFYVSKKEWEYATNPETKDVFCSSPANEYLRSKNLVLLEDDEGELASGLFYRWTPGHTTGSYVLHYQNSHQQRIVFTGDACKTYRELVTSTVAHAFDPLQRSSDSLQWIAHNADIVVPGHFPTLYKSPNGWIWNKSTELELIVR